MERVMPEAVFFFVVRMSLVLIAQTVICFKVKPLIIRLAPAAVLGAITALLLIVTFSADGMAVLGFAMLTVWAATLLAACGLGWAVWGIARVIRRSRGK